MRKTILIFIACMFRACLSVMAQTLPDTTIAPAKPTGHVTIPAPSWGYSTSGGGMMNPYMYISGLGKYFDIATTKWTRGQLNTIILGENLQKVTSRGASTTNALELGVNSQSPNMWMIGTSILQPFGFNNTFNYSDNYGYKLAASLGYRFVNNGVTQKTVQQLGSTPGNSIYSAIPTFPTYKMGDIIAFEAGGINDAINTDTVGYNTTIFKSQLNQIIDAAIAKGFPLNQIFLFSPFYWNASNYGTTARNEAYIAALANVATTRGVLYFDGYNTFKSQAIANTLPLDPSGLHPLTPAVHTVIATSMANYLASYSVVNPPSIQETNYGNLVSQGLFSSQGRANMSGQTYINNLFLNVDRTIRGDGVGDMYYRATGGYVTPLPSVASGSVLLSGGVGSAPLYGKADLSAHTTGILPVSRGGTGFTAPNAFIQNQTTQQTSANINISGTGMFGGAITTAGNFSATGSGSFNNLVLIPSPIAAAALKSITIDQPNSEVNIRAFNADGGGGIRRTAVTANTDIFSSTSAAGLGVIRFITGTGLRAILSNGGNFTLGTSDLGAKFSVQQDNSGEGTISTTAGGTTVTGTNTQFANSFKIGDNITANGETKTVTAIASNTSMTTTAWTNANTNVAYTLVGGTRFQVRGNGEVFINRLPDLSGNNTDPLLVRDASTGVVKYAPSVTAQANKNLTAGNGINALTYNAVSQGGTVSVDTTTIRTVQNSYSKAQSDARYVQSSTARTPFPVTANATMVLNADYLNTTATQYTLTLPPTTGFSTDGSKIITVLATGTGGVKISVPSGYSMTSPGGAATTTGTGGTTITQYQKIQLIPIGTNAYQLQPLNGTVTVF